MQEVRARADELTMVDSRLVGRLIEQAQRLAKGARAKTVHVRAGALSNISPAVLARQFEQAALATRLEGAALEFEVGHDPLAGDALRVFVVRVDLAE